MRKFILSEQGGLSKFFGGTVDDIIRNYGDDAARTLDDVFAKYIPNQVILYQKLKVHLLYLQVVLKFQ